MSKLSHSNDPTMLEIDYLRAKENGDDDIARDLARQMRACPKCSLEASTMLHKFCQHKDCPVR